MKYFSFTIPLVLVVAFLTLNGFQCGSSEMTSAKLYIQQHNLEKADTALNKEIAKNPKNSEAWFLLGQMKYQRQDYASMVDDFNKSLAGDNAAAFAKDIADARKSAWGLSLNKGSSAYNRAITLKKGNEKPDSVTAYLSMASDAYRTAIVVNPDSSITYLNLAIAQAAGNNFDEEIATLKTARTMPHSADVDTFLVDAYLRKLDGISTKITAAEAKKADANGLYSEAFSTLKEGLATYPENVDLLRAQTDFYLRSGKADEAKPTVRLAIAKDPGNKMNYYNLGVLLLQTDSAKAAAEQFEAALKLDKDFELALTNAAISYMKLGDKVRKANQEGGSKKEADKSYIDDFKKAAGYLEHLIELKGDNPNYWESLATAYANAGQVKKAEEALKKADALRKK